MGAGIAHLSAREELQAYLAARDDADAAVGSHMRSQFLAGSGSDVVVLLHGLTASPPAWEAIAPLLHARGASVVVPRLPLHGHSDRMTSALRALTPDVLAEDLRELFVRVSALGGRVTVVGHSLGGTLALFAATTLPGIDRVVAIAPFLGISRVPYEMHRPLLAVLRVVPNLFLWWNPIDRMKNQPLHGYPRYPIRALSTGIVLAEAAVRNGVSGVHAIDLVLNGRESSVSNRAARRLVQTWRTSGASVGLHVLRGLPRSHDIIEPLRPHGVRTRAAIAAIVLDTHDGRDRMYEL